MASVALSNFTQAATAASILPSAVSSGIPQPPGLNFSQGVPTVNPSIKPDGTKFTFEDPYATFASQLPGAAAGATAATLLPYIFKSGKRKSEDESKDDTKRSQSEQSTEDDTTFNRSREQTTSQTDGPGSFPSEQQTTRSSAQYVAPLEDPPPSQQPELASAVGATPAPKSSMFGSLWRYVWGSHNEYDASTADNGPTKVTNIRGPVVWQEDPNRLQATAAFYGKAVPIPEPYEPPPQPMVQSDGPRRPGNVSFGPTTTSYFDKYSHDDEYSEDEDSGESETDDQGEEEEHAYGGNTGDQGYGWQRSQSQSRQRPSVSQLWDHEKVIRGLTNRDTVNRVLHLNRYPKESMFSGPALLANFKRRTGLRGSTTVNNVASSPRACAPEPASHMPYQSQQTSQQTSARPTHTGPAWGQTPAAPPSNMWQGGATDTHTKTSPFVPTSPTAFGNGPQAGSTATDRWGDNVDSTYQQWRQAMMTQPQAGSTATDPWGDSYIDKTYQGWREMMMRQTPQTPQRPAATTTTYDQGLTRDSTAQPLSRRGSINKGGDWRKPKQQTSSNAAPNPTYQAPVQQMPQQRSEWHEPAAARLPQAAARPSRLGPSVPTTFNSATERWENTGPTEPTGHTMASFPPNGQSTTFTHRVPPASAQQSFGLGANTGFSVPSIPAANTGTWAGGSTFGKPAPGAQPWGENSTGGPPMSNIGARGPLPNRPYSQQPARKRTRDGTYINPTLNSVVQEDEPVEPVLRSELQSTRLQPAQVQPTQTYDFTPPRSLVGNFRNPLRSAAGLQRRSTPLSSRPLFGRRRWQPSLQVQA